jgi:hypothetical protein
MRTVAVAAVALAASLVPASADWLWVGQAGHSNGAYACRSYDALEKLDRLMKADTEAALKVVEQDCFWFAAGREFVVDETTFFHDALCVRLRGAPDCVWMDARLTTKH